MTKIMVTGSTGFLGANLVRELIYSGFEVIATAREKSSIWRLKAVLDKIKLVNMDVLDPSSIEKVFSKLKPNIVIHCISYGVDPSQKDVKLSIATNVTASCELLEISAKHNVERFIHVGSCFEYGDKNHAIRENESLQPTAIYGATKSAASILLQERARSLNLNFLILRLFGMWGPLESSYRLVPQVLNACIDKKPLELTGCEQVRDYTYVRDMTSYMRIIATKKKFPAYPIINLGSGRAVLLRSFVNSFAKELGCEQFMKFGIIPYRLNEMKHLVADISIAHSILGKMRRTELSEGVKVMLEESNL